MQDWWLAPLEACERILSRMWLLGMFRHAMILPRAGWAPIAPASDGVSQFSADSAELDWA
jgi:hypothetical protein